MWPKRIIAGSFCALVIFVPLIWLSNTSELFEFNKLLLTYALTIIIMGAWAARMILEKRLIFQRTPIDIPLVLFLLANFCSLLFSLDIHTSWFGYYSRWNGGLLSLLTYALLYWAYVANIDKKFSILNLKLLTASTILVSIWAFFEHFGMSFSCLLTTGKFDVACWVQDVQNRVFATLGQPNWLGAYLVGVIFIPLSYLTLEGSRSRERYWHLLIFNLLFITLLFTKSRSGLLAFGVASVVFWSTTWRRSLSTLGLFALCILLFSLIIQNPIRDLVFSQKPIAATSVGPALEVGGTESGSIRKIVWTGASRIWRANAKNMLLGTGPETFAESYYQYRPMEHNQTSEWELLYNKAHNEFLNYLATTGMVGLGSYVLLLLAMARTCLGPGVRWALFAGWLSLSITNFWGFSVVITQLLLFLFPAIGFTLAKENTSPSPNLGGGWGRVLALAMITFAGGSLLFALGKYWLADVHYAAGQNLNRYFAANQKADYLLAAFQEFSQAYKLNPDEPFISSDLSLAAAYVALASKKPQFIDIALAASQQALATSPHHPNFYKTRAKMLIVLSEIEPKYLTLAAETLAKAMTISPTDPRIPYNLGVVYKYLQATDSAKLYFQKAVQLKPDWAEAQSMLN